MRLPPNPDPPPGSGAPSPDQAIGELAAALEAHLPAIAGQLGDLLGKSAPRISAKERRRFMAGLQRRLKSQWSRFEELDALKTAPESFQKVEAAKAALRGIFVEMLAPPRIRKSPDADRLDWLIALAAKATNPPRASWARRQSYMDARTYLWNLLMAVYGRLPLATVCAVRESWPVDEYKRYVHSLRLFTVAAARFRVRATKRSSDSAAVALQNEYLRAASLFEQQLRFLTSLVRAEPGSVKPWSYWQKQSLNNLVEMASRDDDLAKLVRFIDRHVRNALAHGPPIVERSSGQCQYRDRDACVTWNWEEYFGNTRALTFSVLACAGFESFRQLIEIQIMARILAPLSPPAGEASSS
jgi:hypothetical protein